MKKCSRCGHKLSLNAKFCSKCGFDISQNLNSVMLKKNGLEKNNFQEQKTFLTEAIADVAKNAIDFESFREHLYSKYGITVFDKGNKYSYHLPERERNITEQVLEKECSYEYLIEQFDENRTKKVVEQRVENDDCENLDGKLQEADESALNEKNKSTKGTIPKPKKVRTEEEKIARAEKKKLKEKQERKMLIIIWSVLIILSAIVWSISFFSDDDDNTESDIVSENVIMVKTPFSEQDCISQNYMDLERDFSIAGFKNIYKNEIADLEFDETEKNGLVESITIDGESSFTKNKEYECSATVVITYHTFKNIAAPISSEEAIHTDTDSLIEMFSSSGFVKIDTEEIFDLDPDEIDVEYENYVVIDGSSSFFKDKEFPIDANVKIVTHRPYEKYTLKILVDFIPNIFFNKYDIKLEIDEYSEEIEHGKDVEYEYRLKKGEYALIFSNTESESIFKKISLNLSGDTEVSYKLSCDSESISLEQLYIENKGAIGENEAMVPTSSYDCKYDNYKDVEKEFKEAGFANITTKVLYDIIWGWTEEGEVESVEIDGKTDFVRGDIFRKDADVVITYHMLEKDNPNKLVEQTETVKNEKEQTTDESNEYVNIVPNDELEKLFKSSCTGYSEAEWITFAEKYKNQIIEFEAVMKHSIAAEAGGAGTIGIALYPVYNSEKIYKPIFYISDANIYHNGLENFDFSSRWGEENKVSAKVTIKRYDKYDLRCYVEPVDIRGLENTEIETSQSKAVFYSTNDYETAKKGNKGVFSYRDRGNSYDIYWIIDFDAGYVYYFTDGNGETTCDRLKLDSGDLNSNIKITYHDGGDTWSYKLHFKYVNSPVTLIMVDQNGFEWEYSTTDLDDALELRNTKRIVDY